MTLEFHNRADDLRHGQDVANAPARHRVCLRNRSGNDDMALQIGIRRYGKRLSAIVEKMRIAFVGQQINIAVAAKPCNPAELRIVDHGATGIIGRIHDDEPRLRRQRSLENLRCQSETIGLFGGHEDRIGIDEPRDVRKRDPIRRRDDDVVPFIDHGGKDIENRMLAADVHDAFRNVVLRSELSRVLVNDGFLQLLDSADRRVLREVLLDGQNARTLDVLRRREIRLAGTKVDNIDALVSQFDCGFHNRHGL